MLDLDVFLELDCCSCGVALNVATKCAGLIPGAGKNIGSVKVFCAHCKNINQAVFSADDGTVLYMGVEEPRYKIPVPSYN